MGACVCKAKVHQNLHEYISNSLLLAIESGKLEEVQSLYARFMRKEGPSTAFDVDEVIITLQEVPLNALAYSFRAGQTEVARFLLSRGSASVHLLYATYALIGRTPLDIACEYGFLSLVQYFLPIHLQEGGKHRLTASPRESLEEMSIFVQSKAKVTQISADVTLKVSAPYQPAIHRACEQGHVDVVRYLFEQFRGKLAPADCDIAAVDEKAGENCALIACRSGNLPMIRFLHEECKADFHLLNKRRENAIQISVSGAKRRPGVSYLACVKYLVETVAVDVAYAYEETLLICEDKALAFYLENRLYLQGIFITKTKIDLEDSVSRKRTPRKMTKKSQEIDQKVRDQGSNFRIGDLIEASESGNISSILRQSDLSGF